MGSETCGLAVLRLSGPLTTRSMYESRSPVELEELFERTIVCERPRTFVLDMAAVPYMDAEGARMIARYFFMCKSAGIRMLVVGAGPRVREPLRAAGLNSPLVAWASKCVIDYSTRSSKSLPRSTVKIGLLC
jgi:anti-anti-sigma factor